MMYKEIIDIYCQDLVDTTHKYAVVKCSDL